MCRGLALCWSKSRSRFGHASAAARLPGPARTPMARRIRRAFASRDYRPGFDRAASRTSGLAIGRPWHRGRAQSAAPRESPPMVCPLPGSSRFRIIPPRRRRAPGKDRGSARRHFARPSASRPRRRSHPHIRRAVSAPAVPSHYGPQAPGRPAVPIPRGAPRSTPLDVSPATRLRSTRRARRVRPLTNRAPHVQQQDAHRRRAPGRDPGRGAQG